MIRVEITSTGVTQALLRMDARIVRMSDHSNELEAATEIVYEATRQWYDGDGGGEWPQLAESTVNRKASQGYSDPERPLYASGNLYESATSSTGPLSFKMHPGPDSILIGVEWQNGGWQIPVLLSDGTSRMPARPIWPGHASTEYSEMRRKLTDLMMHRL
jgi:hypothetical protein